VFLGWSVEGNEMWCYLLNTKKNQHACKWRHPISPLPQKFKSPQESAGKMMLTVFFDIEQSLFLDLKPCDNTVNAHRYCQTLQKLCTTNNNKCLVKLTEGINLLHNNVHPHVAHRVQDQLHAMLWEVLKRSVDSPDLLTYNPDFRLPPRC
jgi:histone-lysine N-methyltransferase SETMAR